MLGARPSHRRPPVGVELVLEVDDVDAELERVRMSGWPIDEQLQERPWGLRDFRLIDPSGSTYGSRTALRPDRAGSAANSRMGPPWTAGPCRRSPRELVQQCRVHPGGVGPGDGVPDRPLAAGVTPLLREAANEKGQDGKGDEHTRTERKIPKCSEEIPTAMTGSARPK